MKQRFKIGSGVVRRVNLFSGIVSETSTTPANSFVLDLPKNAFIGTEKLPGYGSKKAGNNAAWTQWSGQFKGTVRVSGLQSCVGLVIVGKPKGTGAGETLVFHLGGLGSNSNRQAKDQAWGVVLSKIPTEIGGVVGGWKDAANIDAIAVAGPAHPGNWDDFVQDYATLTKQIRNLKGVTLRHEQLFWTGAEKHPNIPKSGEGVAAVQLASDGSGHAWHVA